MRLALFLIHAEATGDVQWGGYLKAAEAAAFKPAILWSDDDLALLQGTQVFGTAMQYRHASASPHLHCGDAVTLSHMWLHALRGRACMRCTFLTVPAQPCDVAHACSFAADMLRAWVFIYRMIRHNSDVLCGRK